MLSKFILSEFYEFEMLNHVVAWKNGDIEICCEIGFLSNHLKKSIKKFETDDLEISVEGQDFLCYEHLIILIIIIKEEKK